MEKEEKVCPFKIISESTPVALQHLNPGYATKFYQYQLHIHVMLLSFDNKHFIFIFIHRTGNNNHCIYTKEKELEERNLT